MAVNAGMDEQAQGCEKRLNRAWAWACRIMSAAMPAVLGTEAVIVFDSVFRPPPLLRRNAPPASDGTGRQPPRPTSGTGTRNLTPASAPGPRGDSSGLTRS